MAELIYVHGGMTFSSTEDFINYLRSRPLTKDNSLIWTDFLERNLPSYNIIRLRMPCKENANYLAWKTHFERLLPLSEDVILLGFSLGGLFIAKYLSENKLSVKPKAVILVAPPYNNECTGEDLNDDFMLGTDLSLLNNSTDNLYLFFSDDDTIVLPDSAKLYSQHLSRANITLLSGKGHFITPDFPELISLIRRF